MDTILQDQVAVVTGAGNGIGRAEALALARAGAKVVVNDIGTSFDGYGTSTDPADSVVDEIIAAGGRAVASYASVAVEEEANEIIELAVDTYGRLDILVNNAGVLRHNPVFDIVTEDWDAVIGAHLYGTFHCTRSASRVMRQQGSGRIVNTSSHIGLGAPGAAAYAAAKEAIVGFTRSVARDLGTYGITCNAIRPIAAWRGNRHRDSDEYTETWGPQSIAALVVVLSSAAADDVNGAIFEVWRGHVGIFLEPPTVISSLDIDDHWTVEELMRSVPESLTKGRTREGFPAHQYPNRG